MCATTRERANSKTCKLMGFCWKITFNLEDKMKRDVMLTHRVSVQKTFAIAFKYGATFCQDDGESAFRSLKSVWFLCHLSSSPQLCAEDSPVDWNAIFLWSLVKCFTVQHHQRTNCFPTHTHTVATRWPRLLKSIQDLEYVRVGYRICCLFSVALATARMSCARWKMQSFSRFKFDYSTTFREMSP